MEQYSTLPKEYHFDLLPAIDSFSHCRIFDNQMMIKEYSLTSYNLAVFQRILDLNLRGFSFGDHIYLSDDLSKFYLVGPYLKDYQNLSDAKELITDKIDGLIIVKRMLNNLKSAHQKGFNPYDIHECNYMVNSSFNVLGIDCDKSCCQKEFTFKTSSIPAYLEAFFEHTVFGNFESSSYYFNLYDKMQVLSMILYYLQFNELWRVDTFCSSIMHRINDLLNKVTLPINVQTYLQKVWCGSAPDCDDYFIEELIDPLIRYYASGDIKQRKMNKE